jgi:hypothetical protein
MGDWAIVTNVSWQASSQSSGRTQSESSRDIAAGDDQEAHFEILNEILENKQINRH